jgi:hypothetical protein
MSTFKRSTLESRGFVGAEMMRLAVAVSADVVPAGPGCWVREMSLLSLLMKSSNSPEKDRVSMGEMSGSLCSSCSAGVCARLFWRLKNAKDERSLPPSRRVEVMILKIDLYALQISSCRGTDPISGGSRVVVLKVRSDALDGAYIAHECLQVVMDTGRVKDQL